MPTMLFSAALAKKMLNLNETPSEAQLTEDFAKVISMQDVNEVIKLSENALLITAIIMYPSLFRRIIVKVKGPTSTTWDGLLKGLKDAFRGEKKYYANYDWLCADKDKACCKATLHKLYSIYEEKAGNCFSAETVQGWLRTVGNFLCENFKQGELHPEVIRDSVIASGTCPFFLDRYNHLNMVSFKEDVTTIPQEELNPLIENTLFAQQHGADEGEDEEDAPEQPAPAAPGHAPNPLELFFRSLFQ